jgi:hypothetical protein
MAPAIAISCQMDYQYLSEIFIRNLGTELASITNNNTPTLIDYHHHAHGTGLSEGYTVMGNR